MKNLIFIFIPLFMILSCKHNRTEREFENQLEHFGKRIVKHFPSRLPSHYSSAVFYDNIHDVTSILLKFKYENTVTFKTALDSIIYLSKVEYRADDTCLLVVNRYTNEKNYFNYFKTTDTTYYNKECLKDKLPIPNFWPLGYYVNNICKLPEEYTIYVIEASHDTINEKYLSKNALMPSYWKHGYSKGIATNDSTKEVIYWFVIW